MDYEKMKKEELLTAVEELSGKIQAFEKSSEDLSKVYEIQKRELAEKSERIAQLEKFEGKFHAAEKSAADLSRVMEIKVKELEAQLKKEKETFQIHAQKVTSLQTELEDLRKRNAELSELNKGGKEIREENAKLIGLLNQYVLAYRSLMQSISGSVDNGIALDNLLKREFKKGE